ncbi:MAG: flagellar biosynthesis protein FlhB [Treponema sp.]|nr:flagellar biosynthesis protein FlhB [Treponema sp.]
MAAEDEGRTEEPSEYRLEKARKEGRVAKSQEIGSSLVLLLTIVVLIFIAKWVLGQCIDIFTYYFSRCSNQDVTDGKLASVFFREYIKMILPTSLVAVVAGLIANIIQNKGFIFSWKPLEPKFSKIAPKFGEYFKKTVFSGRGLFNIAKSILKVAIIIIIAYILIKGDIPVLVEIVSNGQILPAVGKIARMAAKILIFVAVSFIAISIPDYFVQKREFMETMKMTKQEVKQEFKELEGDPEVKSRLMQMQRQLLQQNIPKAVSEADVVITNPTHFAVVLKYDTAVADAPMVTAKGEDEMAFTIRRFAKEYDKPIVENKPVARGLYTDTEIGDIIPSDYWKVISVIYSHILNNSNLN